MAGIWIRIRFIWVIAGVVASWTQWRFGIFTVGLQMAMKVINLVQPAACHSGVEELPASFQ